jgi:predicted phage terminase large subunit-like protein
MQEGPQRRAAESPATVVFYGGAAGSGKSFWETFEAAKYFDRPGYGFVVFRRTSGELTGVGSIWAEMEGIYPLLGGTPNLTEREWTFPSGATVKCSHLQHDKDVRKWQGKQPTGVAFDELTHFSQDQFWFLFMRLRTTTGIPTRFLATMNPDPDSWVRDWIDWYIGDDGYPIAERSGVVRWFGRKSGRLHWYETRAEGVADGAPGLTSFTFIAAKIFDNKILLSKDPEYLQKLLTLPPVEQARFLGGNWNIRASSGDFFQSGWFPRMPSHAFGRIAAGLPGDLRYKRQWRFWDFASTPVSGDQVPGCPVVTATEDMRRDADYTACVKVGEMLDGRLVILDARWCRDSSGAVEWWVGELGERDGRACTQVAWQDPAQAGVHQITSYKRALAKRGVRFEGFQNMNSLDVASIASRSAHRGQILVLENQPWEHEFFNFIEQFPPKSKSVHDDHVSALAGAVMWALEKPRAGNPEGLMGVAMSDDVDDAPNTMRLTNRFRSL